MNILIAIETLKTGGAENFVRHLAQGLAKRNAVYILLTSVEFEKNYVTLPGVKLIYPPTNSVIKHWMRRYYFVYQIQYVLQWLHFRVILWRYKIDIIHSHLYRTDFKIVKWLGKNKTPWIIGMHGCYEDYLFDPGGSVSKGNLNRMNGILQRTNFIALASQKNSIVFNYSTHKPPFQIVNYGIPATDLAVSKRVNSWKNENEIVIGMVSRGIESKGWEIGIEAFQLVKAKLPRLKLYLRLIYSESDYMFGLKTRFQNEEGIEFTGFRQNVVEEMMSMDILLFPSYFPSESQPVTIIEALAAGLPVIASDIGEISRMLNVNANPSGVCVAIKDGKPDPECFANELYNLIRNRANYEAMVEAARQNFIPFSIDTCIEFYERLYSQKIVCNNQ